MESFVFQCKKQKLLQFSWIIFLFYKKIDHSKIKNIQYCWCCHLCIVSYDAASPKRDAADAMKKRKPKILHSVTLLTKFNVTQVKAMYTRLGDK